ncbi:MAG: SixA phosphatase family protein [Elusimicrobiales bacterium]
MNEIVLLRHGRALSAREAGVPSDSQRPLSPSGEKDALAAAERLRGSGFSPTLIISSPYLRADRTAEIAAGVFPQARRRTAPELSDGPVSAVFDLAREAAASGPALIVGHMPLLGAVAGVLSGVEPLDLSPAGFARVRPAGAEGPGRLVEFYSPEENRV